jgi:hypothetical protein
VSLGGGQHRGDRRGQKQCQLGTLVADKGMCHLGLLALGEGAGVDRKHHPPISLASECTCTALPGT